MPSRIISNHTLMFSADTSQNFAVNILELATVNTSIVPYAGSRQHSCCVVLSSDLSQTKMSQGSIFLTSLRLPKPCFQSKGCKHLRSKSLEWQRISQTQPSVCWIVFYCCCSSCLAAGYRLSAVSQGEQEHKEQQSLPSCTTSFTIH